MKFLIPARFARTEEGEHMLKILVCVKQVPDVDLVKIDPVTGNLIREGVPSMLNPLDSNALEAAVQVKEKYGGKVTAITMGPPMAETVLRECLSCGADEAVLITDTAFKDADTLATSYTIKAAADMLESFDLIFCGTETLDGATGQMGAQLAERFGSSQITNTLWVEEVNEADRTVKAQRDVEIGIETIEATLPCLLTIEKINYQQRIPNFKSKKAARTAVITRFSVADIRGLDVHKIGAEGSGTIVSRTFLPDSRQAGMRIDEGSVKKNVEKLVKLLSGRGAL